jgi:hypothetical protein
MNFSYWFYKRMTKVIASCRRGNPVKN